MKTYSTVILLLLLGYLSDKDQRFAPLASGPSPSSVGTPRSGNAIKPFFARQFYITGGSVAVAARGCICWVALDDAVLWQDHLSATHG